MSDCGSAWHDPGGTRTARGRTCPTAGVLGMTREERERLAAEHVMGLLEGDEHQRAQALVGTDPAFAAMTRHWSERLSELDESAPALPPDDALWRRIEDGI